MKRRGGKKTASAGPSEPKVPKSSQAMISANNREALEKFWTCLQNRVYGIYEMLPMTPGTKMDTYNAIMDHCDHGLEKISPDRQFVIGTVPGDSYYFAAEQINTKLQHWIRTYLVNLFNSDENITKMTGSSEVQEKMVLDFYMKNWKDFSSSSKLLNGVFRYFNYYYVEPQKKPFCWRNGKKPYEVYDLALIIWRETIFNALKSPVCNAVLNLIREDRRGNPVDEFAVPNVVESLIEMGVDKTTQMIPCGSHKQIETNPDLSVYVNEFESKLLDDTQSFYRETAANYLRTHTPIQYMESVEDILAKETNRVRDRRWYHASTESKITAVCRKVLVEDKLDIIYGQFRPLLEDRKDSQEEVSQREAGLKRLYALVHMLDRPELVNDMVEHYHDNLVSIGRADIQKKMDAIEDRGGAAVFVEEIRTLFEDNKRLVRDVFLGGHQFSTALYKAVKEILRENPTTTLPRVGGQPRPTKSAEYMARYCDLLLRDKTKSDDELDEIFSDVVEFYQLLDDKDVFVQYFIQWTANRFTLLKSSSDDGELLLLQKLEQNKNDSICKLTRLFKDYKTSKDLTNEFNEMMKTRNTSFGYEFNVQTYCQAGWPLRIQTGFNMPSELQASLTEYENFFSAPKDAQVPEGHVSKFNGRKLTWLPALCSGEIRYSPPESKISYTFEASAYQIGIMLLFETRDSMTLDEIVEVTGLSLDIVEQIFKYFLHCKLFRISGQTYIPKQTELTGSMVVELFKEYKPKKTRLPINFPLKFEVKDEEKIDKEIEQQRHFALQALIVRLMKTTRGYVLYNDLVTRVMEDSASKAGISFKPQPRAIQMAVGALINTDYLKRDPENYDSIAYVA